MCTSTSFDPDSFRLSGVIATETTAGLRRPGPTGIYSSSSNRTALADDGDNDD